MKEDSNENAHGSIVPLRLDVTREDLLKEATEAIGSHLNACERGLKHFFLNFDDLK